MSGAHAGKRYVGILGGMGPEATVFPMSRIIARTSAEEDADHVPLIVDNNTQVPSRIKALIEGTGEDPGPILAAMARRLETAGAGALAMPRNTAHHYAPEVEAVTSLPFVNMLELTADRIAARAPERGKVGVPASPVVCVIGLYDRPFESRNLATAYPSKQDSMLRAIRAIKSRSDDPGVRKKLAETAEGLGDQGADLLLIAGTEFSIITDALP